MDKVLSQSAVDSLFGRMLVRYGAGWTRLWEGVDIAAVKAEWARELGNMPDAAIFYGLDYMPADKPPTVKQFRALCQRAPLPSLPALKPPAPTEADKARVRSMMAGLKRKLAMGKVS